MDGANCECGHSWWEHHWNMEYDTADGCMNCQCMLYSKAGTSCYWLVQLYYELEYPNTHKTMPCIKSWIGDEVRYERKRAKSTRGPGRPSDSKDETTEH